MGVGGDVTWNGRSCVLLRDVSRGDGELEPALRKSRSALSLLEPGTRLPFVEEKGWL